MLRLHRTTGGSIKTNVLIIYNMRCFSKSQPTGNSNYERSLKVTTSRRQLLTLLTVTIYSKENKIKMEINLNQWSLFYTHIIRIWNMFFWITALRNYYPCITMILILFRITPGSPENVAWYCNSNNLRVREKWFNDLMKNECYCY